MKTGPKFKIARRLGSRVFSKTQTTKFSISGSPQKAGRGKSGGRPKQLSEYGQQLIEKQKARYTYGLKEHQFANYVKSIRGKKGNPAALLYQALESRLDNVVFRLGLVPTRPFARQVITHGHITVNGRRVNVPSYKVKTGDVVAVRSQSQESGIFKNMAEYLKNYTAPTWVVLDEQAKKGSVKAEPQFGQVEADINFSSILEFYSRV